MSALGSRIRKYLSTTLSRPYSATASRYQIPYKLNGRTTPRKGDKVVVGMSGGVDSSVSALLLAQQDYDLSAIYMRNWDTRDESGTDKGCEWEKDWEDVQIVCRKLGIDCQLVDLSKEYWNRVFEPALRQWELGITPNPDVWCNKEIKFGALLDRLSLKMDENAWFATGHYASKSWSSPSSPSASLRPKLLRPTDTAKDQTYFLSAISETSLSRSLFPLSNLTKPEVRELAKRHELATAERPDSVGICFVGEKARFHRFLAEYIPPRPGPIIHQLTGQQLGTHQGLWSFTVGQNLRVAGQKEKLFVSKKDAKQNIIYGVPGTHQNLMSSSLRLKDFHWIWKDMPPPGVDSDGVTLTLAHRYRAGLSTCRVRRSQPRPPRSSNEKEGDDLIIRCDEPQYAITPGQVGVLYDGDWCLGSGVIDVDDENCVLYG